MLTSEHRMFQKLDQAGLQKDFQRLLVEQQQFSREDESLSKA